MEEPENKKPFVITLQGETVLITQNEVTEEDTACVTESTDSRTDSGDDLTDTGEESADEMTDHPDNADNGKDAIAHNKDLDPSSSKLAQLNQLLVCGICDKLWSNSVQLMHHMETHKKSKSTTDSDVDMKPWVCVFCKTVFSSDEIAQHYEDHTYYTADTSCKICGQMYTSMRALRNHLQGHKISNKGQGQNSKCHESQAKPAPANEKSRQIIYTDVVYCGYCFQGYTSPANLKKHIYSECCICIIPMASRQRLSLVVRNDARGGGKEILTFTLANIDHAEPLKFGSDVSKERVPSKEVSTVGSTEKPGEKSSALKTTENAGLVSLLNWRLHTTQNVKADEIAQHCEDHTDYTADASCKICGLRYTSWRALRNHLQDHKISNKGQGQNGKCNESQAKPAPANQTTRQIMYVDVLHCGYCFQPYTSLASLKKHIYSECCSCIIPMRSRQKLSLVEHKDVRISGKEIVTFTLAADPLGALSQQPEPSVLSVCKCVLCLKIFTTQSSLINHQKMIHGIGLGNRKDLGEGRLMEGSTHSTLLQQVYRERERLANVEKNKSEPSVMDKKQDSGIQPKTAATQTRMTAHDHSYMMPAIWNQTHDHSYTKKDNLDKNIDEPCGSSFRNTASGQHMVMQIDPDDSNIHHVYTDGNIERYNQRLRPSEICNCVNRPLTSDESGNKSSCEMGKDSLCVICKKFITQPVNKQLIAVNTSPELDKTDTVHCASEASSGADRESDGDWFEPESYSADSDSDSENTSWKFVTREKSKRNLSSSSSGQKGSAELKDNVACDICGKHFAQQKSLQWHKWWYHKGKIDECSDNQRKGRRNNDNDVRCKMCNKPFAHISSLTRHKKLFHAGEISKGANHTKGSKHVMRIKLVGNCHMNRPKNKISENSLEDKHNSDSGFRCDICNKLFAQKKSIWRHKKRFHARRTSKQSNYANEDGQNSHSNFRCDICNKLFAQKKSIWQHKKRFHSCRTSEQSNYAKDRINNLSDFRCDICNKLFAHKKSVRKHKKRVHASEASDRANCAQKDHDVKPDIGQLLSIKQEPGVQIEDRQSSLSTELAKYKCDICEKVFSHPQNVKKHKKRIHKAKLHDNHFSDSFTAFKRKVVHSQLNPSTDTSKYKCDICEKNFSHPQNVKKHKKRIHKAKLHDTHFSDSFAAFKRHVVHSQLNPSTDTSKYKCDICEKLFSSTWNVKKHKKRLHKKELREKAKQGWIKADNSQKDKGPRPSVSQRNIQPVGQVNVFKCDICNKQYSHPKNVRRHKVAAHSTDLKRHDKITQSTKLPKEFICEVKCQRLLSKENIEVNQQKIRADNSQKDKGPKYSVSQRNIQPVGQANVFKCDICNKQYSHPKNVRRHKLAAHSTDLKNRGKSTLSIKLPKEFVCEVKCQRLLSNQMNRQNFHARKLLERAKTVKTFTQNKQRLEPSDYDIGTHTEQRNRAEDWKDDFRCDICNKSFSSKSNANKHKKRIHAQELQEKISFSHVEKCARHPSNTKFHARKLLQRAKHAQSQLRRANEFKCDICNQQFSHKYNIKRHKKRFHGRELRKQAELTCNICGQNFSHAQNVKRHKQRFHSSKFRKPAGEMRSVEEFKCSFCNKVFACSRNVRRHRLSVHARELKKQASYAKHSDAAEILNGKHISHKHPANQKKPVETSVQLNHENIRQKDLYRMSPLVKLENISACAICNKLFSCPKDMKRHKWAVHKGEQDNQNEKSEGEKKEQNKDRTDLEKLNQSTEMTNNSVCDICKKTFSCPRNVKRHKLTVHSKELCEEMKDSVKADQKDDHDDREGGLRQTNSGNRSSSDPERENTLEQPDRENKEHMEEEDLREIKEEGRYDERRESTELVTDCVCDVCNKVFANCSNMKRHKRNVHTKENLNQDADQSDGREEMLGQSLFDSTDLSTVCDICTKSFSCPRNVKRHKLTVHRRDPCEEQAVQNDEKKETLKHPGSGNVGPDGNDRRSGRCDPRHRSARQETEFLCDICHQVFVHQSSIKKHKQKFHAKQISEQEDGASQPGQSEALEDEGSHQTMQEEHIDNQTENRDKEILMQGEDCQGEDKGQSKQVDSENMTKTDHVVQRKNLNECGDSENVDNMDSEIMTQNECHENENMEETECGDGKSIAQTEPGDSESQAKNEHADGESIEQTESSDNESMTQIDSTNMAQNESTDSESMTRNEYGGSMAQYEGSDSESMEVNKGSDSVSAAPNEDYSERETKNEYGDRESMAQNENVDSERKAKDKHADGESKAQKKHYGDSKVRNEHADSESMSQNEHADNESMSQNENVDSESKTQVEPADGESEAQNEGADSQSMAQIEDADSKSMAQNECADGESMAQSEDGDVESMAQGEDGDSKSMAQSEDGDTMAQIEDGHSKSMAQSEDGDSMAQIEDGHSKSMAQNECADGESMAQSEDGDGESMAQSEDGDDESVAQNEHADSESVAQNENVDSESKTQVEPADGECEAQNEGADSQSMAQIEDTDSKSMAQNECADGESMAQSEDGDGDGESVPQSEDGDGESMAQSEDGDGESMPQSKDGDGMAQSEDGDGESMPQSEDGDGMAQSEDGDGMAQSEDGDGESMPQSEDGDGMAQNECADGESMPQCEYGDGMAQNECADGESMPQSEDGDGMAQNECADGESMAQSEDGDVESMAQSEDGDGENMAQNEGADGESVAQNEGADSQSMAQIEDTDSKSMAQNDCADGESMAQSEDGDGDGESVPQSEDGDGESMAQSEDGDGESMPQSKDGDGMAQSEDGDGESMPQSEDGDGMAQNECADGESMPQCEYGDGMAQNECADGESMPQSEDGDGMAQNECADGESMAQSEDGDVESMAQSEDGDGENMAQNEGADGESVAQNEGADGESVAQNEGADGESVAQNEGADECMAQNEGADSESVAQNEGADSESMAQNGGTNSESVTQNEYADGESKAQNDHADSESKAQNEHANSESKAQKDGSDSERMTD